MPGVSLGSVIFDKFWGFAGHVPQKHLFAIITWSINRNASIKFDVMRQLLVGGALINLFLAARAKPHLSIIAGAWRMRHLIPVARALEAEDAVSNAI